MGKFEKQNRPAARNSPPVRGANGGRPQGAGGTRPQNTGGARPQRSYASGNQVKKANDKKKKGTALPLILGALVVGVGVVAGLLCMKFFSKESDPTANQIRPDTYIAGINIGGLEKQAALDLLMQTYPPLTPPATNAEGQQEPILSRIYTEDNMSIRVYTTPEEILLYKTSFDPSVEEVPVDIYGNPMPTEETQVTEGTEETQETSSEAEETEATEAATKPDADAPLTEDGKPCLLDKTIVLPASQVNLTLDLTAAVDAAYAIGREGGPEVQEEGNYVDLDSFLTMDEAYIQDVLDSAYEDTLMEGAQTQVEKSTTTIVGEDGQESEVDCLLITFGTMSRKLDTEALYEQIMTAYSAGEFDLQAQYIEELPSALDLDELYETHGCSMPVNAVCDPETFEITEEKLGYGFLMKDAVALSENAKPGDQIILTLIDLKPQHTKDNMKELLFSDVLGSCVSPHVWNPTRTKNLELASKAINGTVLMPGEEFSFNRTVGERTAAKGYGEAGVYVGGRTENQLGGGVCQVASAIYYSCLKADLKIVERYEHQYTPSYVPWGMDATIYWGALDYRFINNTPYPIRMDVSVHDGSVYVELVGTETRNYTVKLDYSIIDENPASEKTIYIHPDMKDYSRFSGYSNGATIQTAYDGYTVCTYMYKYDKDDNLIETIRVNTSEYDRRDREIAYVLDPSKPMKDQIEGIENPTEPTEPPETEPPATDPPETEPPETDPPETDPPETDPTETDPTETNPPETDPPATDPTETDPPTP